MDAMASKSARAEFPRKVVKTLEARASSKCSFPTCDFATSGPGDREDQVAVTGKAAHIYSAGEAGPRGSGGLSFTERQQINNGIWLCAEHADQIDKNNGAAYPAEMLKTYKLMHEQKIKQERGGISQKIGWLHSISIDKGPIFRTPAEITFGKVTVLHGSNGSGKTALCDWLQGISDPSVLGRWSRPEGLSYEVTYLDPFKHKLRVRVTSPDEVEYFLNGERVPFDPNPIRFVRLKDLRTSPFSDRLPSMTDLEFLSKTLSVSPALIRNMVPLVGIHQGRTVNHLRIERRLDDSVVWTDVNGTSSGLDIQRQLSNTERSRVLLEIAAVFARHSAKRSPTILLVDWAAKSFDSRWMSRVIDFLSSDINPFQTVLERVTNGLDGCAMARVINLCGKEVDVTVDKF